MNQKQYHSLEELPLMMNMTDIAAVLGISRAGAYKLAHSADFPAFQIGRRIVVSRENFLGWLTDSPQNKNVPERKKYSLFHCVCGSCVSYRKRRNLHEQKASQRRRQHPQTEKDGRWEGRYTAGYDKDGKVITKNVLGKTQAEVKEKLKTVIEESQKLDPTRTGQYTVQTWVTLWYEVFIKPQIRPNTKQFYRNCMEKPSLSRAG